MPWFRANMTAWLYEYAKKHMSKHGKVYSVLDCGSSFHRITLPFMKSATGLLTSGFCGIVHSTTSRGLCFSFSSFKRQTSRGSHLPSGVTGTLETSLVPSIITNVSK